MAKKGIIIKGYEQLHKRIYKISDEATKQMAEVLSQEALGMKERAVDDAPVDHGLLRGQISMKQNSRLEYEVVSMSKQAAYIEFGTGKKAVIPAGLEAIAQQFRGATGGTFSELLENIYQWVKRKGITGVYSTGIKKDGNGGFTTGGQVGKRRKRKDNQWEDMEMAYRIAWSIAKNGISPHPYFYPNFYIAVNNIKKRSGDALDEAIKKK